MATQSVLTFPCRKARILSPKIMNLENSSVKTENGTGTPRNMMGSRSESICPRSIMLQPRSPRKCFGEISNTPERWTQEDILNEIYKLSPRSPIKELNVLSDSTNGCARSPNKTPRFPKNSDLLSPTRTILSPIRSLSLKSPERASKEVELKRSKILQLKLNRISVSDPKSPVKLHQADSVIPRKDVEVNEHVKNAARRLIDDATPKKISADPDRRITRSSRKLRNQKVSDDNICDDFKENVPPGSCPTPSKKKRPSPDVKKAARTPKSLKAKKQVARKLAINTPKKALCPKKLEFQTDACEVVATPESKLSDKKSILSLHKPNSLPYQITKHALHSSLPDELVGREPEMKMISEYIVSRISCNKSGSLYISGAPGTGKSACTTKVLSNKKVTELCQVVSINCMSTRNASTIYSKIASELGAKPSNCKTVKSSVKYLENALTRDGLPVVLLLDEMDQLDSKNQEVLYTIFEWPVLPKSRLILIGIANALDLTDRILPRLQSRKNCQPDLINFRPYSKDQIIAILEDRVKKMTTADERVIDPMAIQFCARKVSAIAGDARKALDICRRAVEVVETNVKSQHILSSPGERNGLLSKVGLKEIAGVFSEVYESSLTTKKSCGSCAEEESFPLQQKLTICTLILLSRHIKCKEVTVGKLHEAYAKICKKRQVTAVGQSEFLSMLHLIETRGIVSMKAGKQSRMTKVALALREKDVEHALSDKMLLSAILQEGLPK